MAILASFPYHHGKKLGTHNHQNLQHLSWSVWVSKHWIQFRVKGWIGCLLCTKLDLLSRSSSHFDGSRIPKAREKRILILATSSGNEIYIYDHLQEKIFLIPKWEFLWMQPKFKCIVEFVRFLRQERLLELAFKVSTVRFFNLFLRYLLFVLN